MVQVSFNEIRIKYDSSTDKCYDDEFLAVYQGTQTDPKEKLLKKVCGVTMKEPAARATTNLVTLEFRRLGQIFVTTVLILSLSGNHNQTPPKDQKWNGFFVHYTTYTLN